MKNHHLFASGGIGLALIILIAAAFVISFVLERPVPKDRTAEAQGVVETFGSAMQNVPLLAEGEVLDDAFDTHYGALVAPELLSSWKQDPQSAPGRLVSSPAPERIEVSSVARTESGGYQFEANVIETAQGIEASRYPVSITVEERAGILMITGFQKGEYDQMPARMSVTGVYVCLPHRDTSGPQTMECAFGLQADDGRYYALDMRLLSSTAWMDVPTGTRVRVEGPYIPDDGTNKYAIEGAINVTSISPVQ